MRPRPVARTAPCWLFALVLAGGCADPNRTARDATHLTFASLDGPEREARTHDLARGDTVIHFRAGERVPLSLGVDSPLVHLEGGPLTVVFDHDVYLLLRRDGPPLISTDGQDFTRPRGHRNSFAFGFQVKKDEPARMTLRLGIRSPDDQTAPAP